ncbi:MAG: hypothetical protein IJV96_00490 [Clostridia bacterium]|nr:hypothetical protein [Clostridia bacterium]
MKNTFRTNTIALAMLFCLLCTCLLGGCFKETDSVETDFIGTYRSSFVDAQNETDDISFTLTVNEDGTFSLTRKNGETKWLEFSGDYKSYTKNGKKELLCVAQEDDDSTWNPYFVVSMLDDGTLMAVPATNSKKDSLPGIYETTYATTAFGKGSNGLITLVLFEKE